MREVCIELIERQGQRFWQVKLGRRAFTFLHVAAARAFAAQLHMRLGWLSQEQRSDDSLP